jgi:hypothetical protein
MGWKIWRIEAEMTWHDAAMTRLSQWWTRCKRAGHAFAEGTLMHGRAPEYHGVPETRRALIWGLGLPLVIVLGLFITPWALLLALGWGVKMIRLWRAGFDLRHAFFLTLGNLPEAQGALGYYWSRLTRRRKTLIEYK